MDGLLHQIRGSYDGRVSSDAFAWLLAGTIGAFAVILVVSLMRPTVRSHVVVRMALVLAAVGLVLELGFLVIFFIAVAATPDLRG